MESGARGGNTRNNSFNFQCNNVARQVEQNVVRITWPLQHPVSEKTFPLDPKINPIILELKHTSIFKVRVVSSLTTLSYFVSSEYI